MFLFNRFAAGEAFDAEFGDLLAAMGTGHGFIVEILFARNNVEGSRDHQKSYAGDDKKDTRMHM